MSYKPSKILESARIDFMESTIGSIILCMQNDLFLDHKSDLDRLAKYVDDLMKNGKLIQNKIYLFKLCDSDNHPPGIGAYSIVTVILKDDGYAYFGSNQSTAILELGGRFKDGIVEFPCFD